MKRFLYLENPVLSIGPEISTQLIRANFLDFCFSRRSINFFTFIFYLNIVDNLHCVKSVHFRSYSGPYFPAFGLNTERYGVSLRIQSVCGKIQTRKTPNRTLFMQCLKCSKYFVNINFCAKGW